jgi:glycogen operon protein
VPTAFEPERGHRFDPSKLLVDPFATRLDRARPCAELPCRGRLSSTRRRSCRRRSFLATGDRRAAVRPGRATGLHLRSPSGLLRRITPIFRMLRGTMAAFEYPAVIDHLVTLGVQPWS